MPDLLVCVYRLIYELETNILDKAIHDFFFLKYSVSLGSDRHFVEFRVLKNDNQYSKSVACGYCEILDYFLCHQEEALEYR